MRLEKRLWRQVGAARVDLFLTVGLGLLAGVLLAGQAFFLSRIVGRAFLGQATLDDVLPLLLVVLLLAIVRAGVSWGSELAANRVASCIKIELRQRLATHLLALGPAYTRSERTGELTNTVVSGVEALDAFFRQYLPQLALAALIPLVILFIVFPLDWVSGLVLLLTAPLIPVFVVLIGNLAESLTKRQWIAQSRMSAHFLDILQGLTTLKLLGRSRDQMHIISQISDRHRHTTLGVLRVAFLSALVMEMVATLSTAVVAVEIGLRLLYGHLAFDDALLVLLLTPEFFLPLRALGVRFHAGIAGVAAAERIFEVLDEPVAPIRGKAGSRCMAVSAALSLEDVRYTYAGRGCAAVNGLSFRILPGQKVALVGPSGAGKSTVAYLLMRFINPDSGSIAWGDQSVATFSPSAWREQFAWVPQRPYVFHTTVAENIRVGDATAGRARVVQAAQQAHAHEFIQALPRGYDTVIEEGGTRLSAGQAQRIALARAFLKGAPFLILDEATSNLDPALEALLQESLERLMDGRSALIIAHRLNTVYRADQILVMDAGQVVEQGTHDDLLRQGGLYRHLASTSVGFPASRDGSTREL